MEFVCRKLSGQNHGIVRHDFEIECGRSETLDAGEVKSVIDWFPANGIDVVWDIHIGTRILAPKHIEKYTGHRSPPTVTTEIFSVLVSITDEQVAMAFKLAWT